MKRLFFVLLIILITVIVGQLQFENIDNDFRNIINLIREIVAWFFAILIVISGIVAAALNLNKKKLYFR